MIYEYDNISGYSFQCKYCTKLNPENCAIFWVQLNGDLLWKKVNNKFQRTDI